MAISPTRCSELIRAYDVQGWHRTATPGDERATAWLIEALNGAGVEARAETFAFERIDAESCRVTIGGDSFDAVPLVDSVLPDGAFLIAGKFSDQPGKGAIAATRARHQGEDEEFDSLRTRGWEAVVAAVGDPAFGPALRNAARFTTPYGSPVFQVAASAWPALAAARAAGASVRIEGVIRRSGTTASNVVASIPAAGGGRPLAVLTPKSGWWHCAGERGGGIAVFLELAMELAVAPLRHEVVFAATTGHELGFLGIRRHFEREPLAATTPVAWLHLGANIGGAATQTVIRSCDAELDGVLRRTVNVAGRTVAPQLAVTPKPQGGEAAVVAEFGGRFVSVVGRDFAPFHSIDDRWPDTIDAPAIAANAELMLALLRELDSAAAESNA